LKICRAQIQFEFEGQEAAMEPEKACVSAKRPSSKKRQCTGCCELREISFTWEKISLFYLGLQFIV
jgi:hypothetical protein